MTKRVALVLLCCFTLASSACATKSFVQEQFTATDTKLDRLASIHDAKLRETADLARANREAVAGAERRLERLDRRTEEVSALASSAKTDAGSVAALVQASEARLSQRLAGRNRYRLLETRTIYFNAGRAHIRTQDVDTLEQVANALKADPNAVSEVQGFADPRGGDRYNDELSRARVDAVLRHLVQRHGVELRQLHAAAMGETLAGSREKVTAEALASARRVEIRLLAPWSSWEDRQAEMDDSSETAGAASPATTEERRASPHGIQPEGTDGRAPVNGNPPAGALRRIINTISKEELGGSD